MIIYYNNRELSHNLGINHAKWKRWSREFLPPDPLGGLQSGYARQYSMREAFLVALGGHLVGFLKFSVHQAKAVLHDLEPWLEKAGYFHWNPKTLQSCLKEKGKNNYCILIRVVGAKPADKDRLYYAIFSSPLTGLTHFEGKDQMKTGRDMEFISTPDYIQGQFMESPFLYLLSVGQFRKFFLSRLHPELK